MARAEGDGPLRGLRVLDIATIIAGPLAGTLMADFGAEVIKLELPGVGDGMRGFPPFKDGKSLWWKVTNRGKLFATLDLRKPEGKALFLRMVAKSDVVIENFRPGTLERWGLDIDTLWKANPRRVVLRVSGFGQDGPHREMSGLARIFEAMGGLTGISGSEDGPPMHTGYPIGDPIGALFGGTSGAALLLRPGLRNLGSRDLPSQPLVESTHLAVKAVDSLLEGVEIEPAISVFAGLVIAAPRQVRKQRTNC